MKILINKPQYLSERGIKVLTEEGGEGSKFIGTWSLKDKYGNWTDVLFDIFYLVKPREDGLTLVGYRYDSIFRQGGLKVNAESSFTGDHKDISCLVEDRVVYVSRYRHDFISTPKGLYLDGGRDYTRSNAAPNQLYNVFFDVNTGKYIMYNPSAHGYTPLEIEYSDYYGE